MAPLFFDISLAEGYKSNSQRARILTEPWVEHNAYCPRCGGKLQRFQNGSPVADLFCTLCHEEFELKSKSGAFTGLVPDGAYRTMMERLRSARNPNLFLLSYAADLSIARLTVIPKFFFVPRIIEERPPLSPTARRAGWVGCNIRISGIPEAGKIDLVTNGELLNKKQVLKKWSETEFIQEAGRIDRRQWLIDTLECVEKMKSDEFTLQDMYRFTDVLSRRHPDNRHVQPKIRQQLQVLRDHGMIEFLGNGRYKKKH
jgi:type II restriction enzyme